jgi:cation diffusion facilitator family transporter
MTDGREKETRSKRRAAGLSVASNTVLVLGKLVVGVVTGSVAVISEAVHSAMDLLAALIAFAAVSLSGRPPDASHSHGHGKIEDLSGAVEALLIFGAVVFIGYESINKLVHGSEVRHALLGVAVMAGSSLINIGVSWYLYRVGKRTDSVALLADAAHLRTDVYTSLGVLVGLLAVHLSGLSWIDPLAAMLVALLIVREAWQITRRSVGELLDESLPAHERELVQQIIAEAGHSFHALRSRKSGAERSIDLHLEVSPKATVQQVHTTCDALERAIMGALPRTQVLIHPEPALELDRTQPLCQQVQAILDGHRELFRSYSEIHAYEFDDGPHISMRLELDPALTMREAQGVIDHLTTHVQHYHPSTQVYIHSWCQRPS